MQPIDEISGLIKNLYAIVARLEELFPGRPFTPDGHLVGSLGEVIAAHRYGLTLLPCSTPGHDCTTAAGAQVEVKATQGKSVALRSQPRHLIVLSLGPDGDASEVYDGPGDRPWPHAGKMQRNGQRPISLAKLRELMQYVPEASRIPALG
jgi:hypothetical protein